MKTRDGYRFLAVIVFSVALVFGFIGLSPTPSRANTIELTLSGSGHVSYTQFGWWKLREEGALIGLGNETDCFVRYPHVEALRAALSRNSEINLICDERTSIEGAREALELSVDGFVIFDFEDSVRRAKERKKSSWQTAFGFSAVSFFLFFLSRIGNK